LIEKALSHEAGGIRAVYIVAEYAESPLPPVAEPRMTDELRPHPAMVQCNLLPTAVQLEPLYKAGIASQPAEVIAEASQAFCQDDITIIILTRRGVGNASAARRKNAAVQLVQYLLDNYL
jgi:hypothetical protein